MKLAFFIILAGIVIAGYVLSSKNNTSQIKGNFISQTISVDDFEEKYNTGEYQMIDVRTPGEYQNGTVFPDPLSIDFYDTDFKQQLDKLDKDQKYLIYCRSGGRSKMALKTMKSLGFTEVYELQGGKNAWEKSGRSLVSN